MNFKRLGTIGAIAVAGSLLLASCAANEIDEPAVDEPGTSLEGTLAGTGASAQGKAQEAWIAAFVGEHGGVDIAYDGGGSGAGRTAILEGGVDYAGSDRAFKIDELPEGGFPAGHAKAAEGATLLELPLYISPIAIGYNVEGVDELNLDAATIARIFAGEITNWNDAAIAEQNPGATLPDLAITTIHRSTNSGTTENFTDYLSKVAPEAWPFDKSGDWPAELTFGEAVAETADVAGALANNGTIGYLDASRAPGTTVSLKVGDEYVKYSPEAAAAVVDASPLETGRDVGDIAIALDRKTTAAGAYPLVLVSYVIVYSDYLDDAQAEIVKAFLTYAASAEGQVAAASNAGSAPISDTMRAKVQTAIDSIQ